MTSDFGHPAAGSTQPPASNAWRSAALSADLAAHLDHTLYFRGDGPFCNQGNCAGCKAHPELDEIHFAPRHRMTVRELLVAIKAHVENSTPPDGTAPDGTGVAREGPYGGYGHLPPVP